MAKLNDIRALAESHAAEIARSVQAWTGYLDTAATLYRYDFPETLLIHAQRPDATACAEMEGVLNFLWYLHSYLITV